MHRDTFTVCEMLDLEPATSSLVLSMNTYQ